MFKVSKGDCPLYMRELFKKKINENVPALQSSSEHSFNMPRPYKETLKQSLTYSGPVILNSLPSTLESLDSIDKFHSNFYNVDKKILDSYRYDFIYLFICLFLFLLFGRCIYFRAFPFSSH